MTVQLPESPMEKLQATARDPKVSLLYAAPKLGKSTIVAQLHNSITLDLENAHKYLDSAHIPCIGISPPDNELEASAASRYKNRQFYLREAGKMIVIHNQKHGMYDFLIWDTITALEEWCEREATLMYMESGPGRKFNRDKFGNVVPSADFKDVIGELEYGGGYFWLRTAFKKWVIKFHGLAKHIILLGHLKDKVLVDKDGNETNASDIDLTGKIRNITCARADAIAFLYRKGDERYLSFKGRTDDDITGNRAKHLDNKNILISKLVDGNIETYWDQIFID